MQTLGFGQFFGHPHGRCDLAGFSLSRVAALAPPVEIPAHTHETAHVVVVLDGAYVTTAARPEPGRTAALVYNPPGTTHHDRFRGHHGTFFTLSISERRFDALDLSRSLPRHAVGLASGLAVRRARRLMRLCESWPPSSAARAEERCIALLLALGDPSCHRDPQPPRWLAAARDALAGRYGEAVSVRELAAGAAVHPVHLIRSFRRFYGVTPAEYLRARRLESAAALLESTALPIVEIALRTGYADQSHLTRAFTRAHAMPPATYRRRRREARARNSG